MMAGHAAENFPWLPQPVISPAAPDDVSETGRVVRRCSLQHPADA
jgi:hypothetical protein